MIIQYFSDIHLEFFKEAPTIMSTASVLCLAGDIGYPFSDIYKRFLINLNAEVGFKKIFMITGNHEYYNEDKSIDEINCHIHKIIAENNLHKISFLNNTVEYYDGYLFVGTTLWSHVYNSHHVTNDFSCILNMTIDKYNELHADSRKFIELVLNEHSNKKIIILSHFLPSFKILNPKYDNYSKYNQCFASNCDELIIYPIRLWIYGHTHTPKLDMINEIPITCNPIGYVGENACINYQQLIEIK